MGKLGRKWEPEENEEEGKKMLETSNTRDLFIVGQTILERLVDKVLIKKFGISENSCDDPRFAMQFKMDILSGSDLLVENLRSNIAAINHLRNMHAHRLEVEFNVIKVDIDRLKYLGTMPEEDLGNNEIESGDERDEIPKILLSKYRICVIQTFDELKKLL